MARDVRVLWTLALLAAALLVWAAPAFGLQAAGREAFDPSAVIDPDATKATVAKVATDEAASGGTTGPTGTTGSAEGVPGSGGTPTPGGGEEPSGTGVETIDPFSRGYGAAAGLPENKKRAEAKASCEQSPLPPSRMLGIGSRVDTPDDDRSWPALAIVIFLGAVALAAGAFVLRRLRAPAGTTPEPKGALEIVATLVATFAAIGGLAAQFAGVGATDPVPREATLIVRDVDARITRGEYADKVEPRLSKVLGREDRLEVGNVIWLELGLRGYDGEQLGLQWAALDPDEGQALLFALDKPLGLPVPRTGVDTRFIPIWVGYPASKRFVLEFRLLEQREVRQLADTGPMKASKYRYACPTAS